jgi:N-acyl-D-amino-acid deacylase
MTFTLANGTICDGTGSPGARGNVVISNDRIVAAGPDVAAQGDVVDVTGLAVSPGFIDMHSHCDLVCMSDPQLAPKLMQGVTLELLGQDGLSEAPIREEQVLLWRRHLSGLNGDPDLPWDWRTFGEYLDRCAGASTNVAAMVGHGTIRLHAMGMDARPPEPDELQEMRRLVDESIQHGAIGFSTGLIYSPCVYGDTEELIRLGEVVASHDSFMVYHMRFEGEAILTGMEEVFEIARQSGAACHISHFKARGKQAWGKAPDMIDAVERARAAGLDITADQYPYTAGSTMLAALLPPWAHAGGIDNLNRMLQDSMHKDRMRRDMLEGREDWESSVVASGFDSIRISGVKTDANEWVVGKTLDAIAAEWGVEPFEAVVRLLLEEDHEVSMILFTLQEDDVHRLMVQPWLMTCSDGLMGGTPHPRTYGTFPRVLGHYVREEGLMPLEDAVRRMTGLSAWRLGLPERGVLAEGNFADVTVFDPASVIDRATYDNPMVHPDGIVHVYVNGVAAVRDGRMTGNLAGRVLRREVAAPGTQRVV